jgi:ligand-binding sensor domain-containing protein
LIRNGCTPIRLRIALVCAMLMAATAVQAQSAAIDMVVSAQTCASMLYHDGRLYGGLSDGGILIWDTDGTGDYERWTTLEGLSGNRITDMDRLGDTLWVATDGGGLTRIAIGGARPDFRLFTNIGDDLAVSTVAVTDLAGGERVYFGLVNGGVGVISNGLAGNIFTSEGTQGGLVNDRIRDMVFDGDDLWIATDEGVSRLRNNAFADMSSGIGYVNIACLLVDPVFGLLAGDVHGVWQWDAQTETWSDFGDLGLSVVSMVVQDGILWVLRSETGGTDRLYRWGGSSWTMVPLPDSGALTLDAGDRLRAAGSRRLVQANYKALQAWTAGYDGADWTQWTADELLFTSVDGVSVGPDGVVWMGARNGAGFAGYDNGDLEQVYEFASAADDSVGLYNVNGGFLDVHATTDGEIWMTQFAAGGAIRYRPDLPDADHIEKDTSPLTGNRIIRIADHPDGPILLMSDRTGVDVLLDKDQWRDEAQWLYLPTDNTGLGSDNVSDALVGASPDQIWFVVKDVGLVLWDIDGSTDNASSLTWTDDSDDLWSSALTSISGTTYDLTGAKAVAVADDGTLWVGGGSGVIHFRFNGYEAADHDGIFDDLDVTLLHAVFEKVSPSMSGLMQGSVLDIELDRNDDLWAAHAAGLDRVSVRGGEVSVDAFTGPAQFAAYGLIANYSANILAGLPGGMVRELASNASGSLIVGGSEGGLILIDVGPAVSSATGPLDALYLYPSPLKPDEHAGLYLGDIDADVTWGQFSLEGGAFVEIYDVSGQLIYRDRHVAADTPFWTGVNLEGDAVASGVYMARVELEGQIRIMPIALAR